MSKLSLDIDALQVESFEPAPPELPDIAMPVTVYGTRPCAFRLWMRKWSSAWPA